MNIDCPICTKVILNRKPGYIFVSGPAGGGYFDTCELCGGTGSIFNGPGSMMAKSTEKWNAKEQRTLDLLHRMIEELNNVDDETRLGLASTLLIELCKKNGITKDRFLKAMDKAWDL